MTRAVDRLIVAGSIDPDKAADERTPIGWVLGRLEIPAFDDLADGPVELEREGARILLRLGRFVEGEPALVALPEPAAEPAQLALFEPNGSGGSALVSARSCRLSSRWPEPPLHRVRRCRTAPLALVRVAVRTATTPSASPACARRKPQARSRDTRDWPATEIGDSVHFLLERLDLRDPRPPEPHDLAEAVRARGIRPRPTRSWSGSPGSSARIATRSWPPGSPRSRGRRPSGRSPSSTTESLLHGRLDVLHLDGPRAVVVDYKTNVLERRHAGRGDRARLPPAAARLRAGLLPCRGRGGRGRLPVPRAARPGRDHELRPLRAAGAGSGALGGDRAGFRRACSSRRRASSSAPAARCSTSSAQAAAAAASGDVDSAEIAVG